MKKTIETIGEQPRATTVLLQGGVQIVLAGALASSYDWCVERQKRTWKATSEDGRVLVTPTAAVLAIVEHDLQTDEEAEEERND